mmetsp:Transcript_69573/g.123068  ORF Transcript_69573/g.123068 Transcript_69573/m.123068 type:complete len:275 (+) Transcript_69573:726-1550(+)
MPQQLVQVLLKFRRHEMMQTLHVAQDQEVVLDDDRKVELPLLVLDNLCSQRLHLRVVRGPTFHGSALGRGGQELSAVLQARGLIDVVPHKLQGFDHHAIGCIVLGPLVVANENHRYHEKQEEEEKTQNCQMVVLLQEEARQTNANFRCLRAIRIAILLVVCLCSFISQSIVRLGDLDESGSSERIIGILVRMVNQGELPVSLLDIRSGRARLTLEDVKGVVPFDLICVREMKRCAHKQEPHARKHNQPCHRQACCTWIQLPCLLSRLRNFLNHL